MKINQLRLKNFRSYEDETTFNFSTSADKNIILIGGRNGAGKSTIFEALKLCIYGPLAYKYQGSNSVYKSKIKSNINYSALKKDTIETFISVDLELKEKNDLNYYTLKRTWTYVDKKLEEDFSVIKNNASTQLDEKELSTFIDYLNSILSPKIFDFFFFDGEYLSDFFIGRNANEHLKDSLLTLCNYDTLSTLKSLLRFSRPKRNENHITDLRVSYQDLEDQLRLIEDDTQNIELKIDDLDTQIKDLIKKRDDLNKKFKRNGGLIAKERESLVKSALELEQQREETNQQLKEFYNDILPLLALKDSLLSLKMQLTTEGELLAFESITEKLKPEMLQKILSSRLQIESNSELATTIMGDLSEALKPSLPHPDFKPIHDLSAKDSNSLINFIDLYLHHDHREIYYDLFNKQQRVNLKLSNIRDQLNKSSDDHMLTKYLHQVKTFDKQQDKINELHSTLMQELKVKEIELDRVRKQYSRAKEEYLNAIQDDSVTDVVGSLDLMLNEAITKLTQKKLTRIAKYFIEIFSKLMRKNHYIDHIDINEHFEITLYKKHYVNLGQLKNMMSNFNLNEFKSKFGSLFIEEICDQLGCSIKNIVTTVNDQLDVESLILHQKVDSNNFSNGEKQIYVLCLYWSITKAAGVNLPFIIDTPYARIDEAHRSNLSSEFFKTISDQVIILSTNTEITQDQYKELKGSINTEYLIEYNDTERKTDLSEGYFYEVI